MLIKFDGCVVRRNNELKKATVGYEIHTPKEGKLASSGRDVTNEITYDNVYSTDTEYYALYTGLQVARDIAQRLDDTYHLRIQGDAQNVLRCVDPSRDDNPSSSNHINLVNKIQRLFGFFDGNPQFQKISSESNSAHDNANGARSRN